MEIPGTLTKRFIPKGIVAKICVLKHYSITINEEVTLQCDGSKKGLGAVLRQNGQPVAFASHIWMAQ